MSRVNLVVDGKAAGVRMRRVPSTPERKKTALARA